MESKTYEPGLMMVPAMMNLLKKMADSLMVLSAATFDPEKTDPFDDYTSYVFKVGMERPLATENEFIHATETAKHMAQLTYAYIDRMGNAQLLPMHEAVIVWDKIHEVYNELIYDIDIMYYCKESWIHDKFGENTKIIGITSNISRILEKFDENELRLSANDVDEINCYMSDYYDLGCIVWDFSTDIEELQRIVAEGEVILNKLETAISYLKLNKTNNPEKINDIMEHGEVTTEVPCIPVPGDKVCAENHAIQAASGSGEMTHPNLSINPEKYVTGVDPILGDPTIKKPRMMI